MAPRSEPNGYTLLLGSTNLTVLPDMTKVNYDPIPDFVPVSLMATSTNIRVRRPRRALPAGGRGPDAGAGRDRREALGHAAEPADDRGSGDSGVRSEHL